MVANKAQAEFMVFYEIFITVMLFRQAQLIFNLVFVFAPSFLRTFSVSILVLSIGKILGMYDRMLFTYLKYIIYVWFLLYAVYDLGVFTNLEGLNMLDWSTLAFSVIAPISMLIVGKQVAKMKVKGHKIFGYYVMMLIYILIASIWFVIFPEQVNMGILLMYWGFIMVIVWLWGYVKGV